MPALAKPPKPDEQITQAARRVLGEHGYAGLTLERIADHAGISRVTLHRRGHSKDQIFNALVTEATLEYRDAMWPALALNGTGSERLRAGLKASLELTETHLDLLLAVRAQTDALYHQATDAKAVPQRGVIDPIELLIRDGVSDGSLRQVDPSEMALLLTNWVGWTYVHLRTAHRYAPKAAHNLILKQTMQALTP